MFIFQLSNLNQSTCKRTTVPHQNVKDEIKELDCDLATLDYDFYWAWVTKEIN